MKEFDVWMEGYRATGDSATATHLGKQKALSFKEACKTALEAIHNKEDMKTYYNEERNTFWGCRLFDNEVDARKNFG